MLKERKGLKSAMEKANEAKKEQAGLGCGDADKSELLKLIRNTNN